jgi:hypothetical protein
MLLFIKLFVVTGLSPPCVGLHIAEILTRAWVEEGIEIWDNLWDMGPNSFLAVAPKCVRPTVAVTF